MLSNLRKWLQISLINLLFIASIGVILRYKIAYSLPFINQKYLLHAHSHFAFSGWVTQALMALLVAYLSEVSGENYFRRYRWILFANLGAAYGMLFTFPFEGYAFMSILFSTASVFVSYFFSFRYWRDMNRLPGKHNSHAWFKIALLGNVISSVGPFTLAYMMASKHIPQNEYLASVYFFLHFQYNVWFFFACAGLLIFQLGKYCIPWYTLKKVFHLFALACLPAFLLSVLWWPIPDWLYILVIAAVICQLAGWIILVRFIRRHREEIKERIPGQSRMLFLLCAIAFSIKLCLQALSVIPSLSQLAFGFRPIVIGYLHLVLLGVITIFILAYAVTYKLISINKTSITGIWIFVTGILINELFLMIQGVSDLLNEGVPYIGQYLLAAAVILFAGMLITVSGQKFRKADLDHKSISA